MKLKERLDVEMENSLSAFIDKVGFGEETVLTLKEIKDVYRIAFKDGIIAFLNDSGEQL